MDVSPILDQTNVIIGLFLPFVTAVLVKARETDWVKGAVSVVSAAIAGIIISAGHDTGFDFDNAVNEASGIIAVHLASWAMLTRQAVAWLNDRTKDFGLGRS